MRNKIISILLIAILFTAFGCKKPVKRKSESNKDELVSVFVQQVQPQSITDYVKLSGRLESASKIDFMSEVSGNIEKIYKNLGDYVVAGDSLGRLKENDFVYKLKQAKFSLKSSELNYEITTNNKEISETLFKENSISFIEYNQSLSNWNNAKASLEMAKSSVETAKRNYENSIFVAPISGYISYLPVSNGQHINMGQQICRIVQLKKMKIKTGVTESDIISLNKNDTVKIYYDKLNLYLEGFISGLGKDLIPGKNSYPIEIIVDNSDKKLLPGMIVEATIKTLNHKKSILLPVDAIQKYFDTNYVYCASNNIAVKKEVIISKVIDNSVIIKSGLDFGELVIVSGTDELSDGTKLKVQTK